MNDNYTNNIRYLLGKGLFLRYKLRHIPSRSNGNDNRWPLTLKTD